MQLYFSLSADYFQNRGQVIYCEKAYRENENSIGYMSENIYCGTNGTIITDTIVRYLHSREHEGKHYTKHCHECHDSYELFHRAYLLFLSGYNAQHIKCRCGDAEIK